MEPVFPALAGRFLPSEPLGEPRKPVSHNKNLERIPVQPQLSQEKSDCVSLSLTGHSPSLSQSLTVARTQVPVPLWDYRMGSDVSCIRLLVSFAWAVAQ